MQNAESALQRARADGRGVYRFFEPATDDRLRQRAVLELDLRHALEVDDELQVHYQPLYHADQGTICGFEALCRWTHPVHGPISPVDFIAIAEESGLILPLGEKVLRIACLQAATWPENYRIAVNLSPTQFRHPALVETVMRILHETGLPGDRLELEITEGVLIHETERALATMAALKSNNIRIASGRFRYRLLQPQLPAPLSVRRHQDRPFVRQRPGNRQGSPDDRHRHRPRSATI